MLFERSVQGLLPLLEGALSVQQCLGGDAVVVDALFLVGGGARSMVHNAFFWPCLYKIERFP